MPSTSKKQARFMAMCAHSDHPNCPPKKVSREFNQADKGTGILRGRHHALKRGYHKVG